MKQINLQHLLLVEALTHLQQSLQLQLKPLFVRKVL